VNRTVLAAFAAALAAALPVAAALRARAIDQQVAAARADSIVRAYHAHRTQWARERDSLVRETGRQGEAVRVQVVRVRDTTWLPADTALAVRYPACRAELDRTATLCEQYRVTATSAVAAAERQRVADSLLLVRAARDLAGAHGQLEAARRAYADSLARIRQERDRKPGWRGVVTGALSGAAAAALGFLAAGAR
jgi:hypothetical protein